MVKIHPVCLCGLLLFASVCNAKDWSLRLEVGVDTWLHLAVRDGNLCFLGDPGGVSNHNDLKRWKDYHYPSPTARVSLNGRSREWDMRQPLPLDIPSAAKLRIKSVELVSSGRSEVSMHPGTHDMNRKPPDNIRRNDFILWNEREVKVWDDGPGASPYIFKIVLSSSRRRFKPQRAWTSKGHWLLRPSDNPDAISLEKLILDPELGISQLHRSRISKLKILDAQRMFQFQDKELLYAQYFGKSKNRLLSDKIALLEMPVLEVATCFTREGDLRCMDFIMYCIDESVSVSQEQFFKQVADLLAKMNSRLGPPKETRRMGFQATKNQASARWRVWQWTCGDKLVELNAGYEEKAKKKRLGRYIFVRIAPIDSGGSPQMATLADLQGNLSGTPGQCMVINHIPMVNQGQKGYCVPATYSMGLLYLGLDVNQYNTCLFMANWTDIEVYLRKMNLKFRRDWYEIGYLAQKGFAPRDPIFRKYNKRKSAKYPALPNAEGIYKEYDKWKDKIDTALLFPLCENHRLFQGFRKFIINNIDNGVPVFWGVHGHARMIIGYDLPQKEIIYRDTWGIGHVQKRMSIYEAFMLTNGCSTITPLK